MARLSKRWRKAKHRGTIVSLLLLMVFLISLWYSVAWGPGPAAARAVGYQFSGATLYVTEYAGLGGSWGPSGWRINLIRPSVASWYWTWRVPPWTVRVFPLWIPALLIILPTAWLWWKDKPIKDGLCQLCGYSLTGLSIENPTCPECGSAITPPSGRQQSSPA